MHNASDEAAAPPPQPGGGVPAAPSDAFQSVPRAARTKLGRFGAYGLSRLNLAGMLVVATGLCAFDVAVAGSPFWSAVLTALLVVYCVPWAYTVLTLDRVEVRLADAARDHGGWRAWRVGAHVVVFAALTMAMTTKVLLAMDVAGVAFGAAEVSAYRQYTAIAFVIFLVGLLGRGSRMGRLLATVADHPARLMALTFGVIAFSGGVLLTLPVCLVRIEDTSFVDGLFTAMSAVCVTGLAVNDISSTYTFFGQLVILGLVQVGGLGIMVMSSAVVILAGRRLRARGAAVLAEMIDADSVSALRRTLKVITLSTLAIEAVGAFCLYVAFARTPEVAYGPEHGHAAAGAGSLAWSAVFHSVSAFCNAGFSLSHGNMAAFVTSPSVCLVVAGLIVAGGIGFPVLEEVAVRVRDRRRGVIPRKASLHLRTVLLMSALLLAGGTLAFLLLEWAGALAVRVHGDEIGPGGKLLAAFFQSVSTRTAGFNTVDFGAMAPPIIVLTCILMFIGASPGSTGGGIKTTTFAVLLASFRAEVRGAQTVTMLDRAVPPGVVRKALGVVVVSSVFLAGVSFLLLVTESSMLARYREQGDGLGALRVVFEAVSAFATCGLSTGITSQLSPAGKIILVFTMFAGRIGPLTLAVAAASKARSGQFAPPEERVLIG
ncbi:MAG: hypothetical protein HMLKMBBP_03732 [Planctomycetes bacterium]|nr:hypothetical protein [Planctomycetota bacterium]